MIVGMAHVDLFIPEADCLKAKRSVIKGLKDRLKNSFNISVAEVDYHDKWQRAALGIAAVGTDQAYINGVIDKALDLIRSDRRVHLLDFGIDFC